MSRLYDENHNEIPMEKKQTVIEEPKEEIIKNKDGSTTINIPKGVNIKEIITNKY